ncbi:MAG: 3-phosphoshikimate 1-carboxyvinyltransferase [Bdellovibrio sp.]|nr:3-phosphoshikimate 1-carboxyvinyltransferase [Bdellovibrio sp.]
MNIRIEPLSQMTGTPRKPLSAILLPADKSISHRGLIFGALASGTTRISGLLRAGDVQSTQRCLSQLGVGIETQGTLTLVHGKKFIPPLAPLDCGNSGTTLRLLMGILAGECFSSELIGDSSLSARPMGRIAVPLRRMGAEIYLKDENYSPVQIKGLTHGVRLKALNYALPIGSAQLKSALLFAGLQAEGTTRISGKIQSRDHTERMLKHFGAQLNYSFGEGPDPQEISICGGQRLIGADLKVPKDPSSAAYWVALSLLSSNIKVELKEILLNSFRIGFLAALKRMGAQIETEIQECSETSEPVGTLLSEPSPLQGTGIAPEEISSLIDEIPLIAVVGAFAEGTTEIRGAAELRVKESDRIEATATNLRKMGVDVETFSDGMKIYGKGKRGPKGAKLSSYGDHRIAMSFAIAGMMANGPTEIENCECVSISYPDFFETLKRIYL